MLLKDSNVKACDFRSFKAEVHDIPRLAEYLKKSTVIGVAFNNGISQEAKISLDNAKAARNGSLKVQYSA